MRTNIRFVPATTALSLALVALLVGCGTDGTSDGPGTIQLNDGGTSDGGATSADTGNSGADASVDNSDVSVAVDTGPRQRGSCPVDRCAVADGCFENGKRNPNNACQICAVLVRNDDWSADDAAKCDDNSPCTTKDRCDNGLCKGDPGACNDNNPCTTDRCEKKDGKSTCAYAPNPAPCSDGDVCTVGDKCEGTKCTAGKARDCNDGNACTSDSCNPEKGCSSTPLTSGACNDSNPCTDKDACNKAGACAGKPMACDDNNLCTLDGCSVKTGCKHKNIASLCKDDSVCTDDKCDPKSGCVYGFTTKPCNDANVCTTGDACAKGICIGQKVATDDKNPCTNDSCDAKTGVKHVANTLPCDDGDKCTVDDVCANKACKKGKAKVCKDGNSCTDDSCAAKTGCVFKAHTKACDDGNKCTEKDACKPGAKPADAKCVGTKVNCNDGSACTTDACDTKKGCTHTLVVSNTCRPVITVTYPPRGATIKKSTSTITIKGKVVSGAGPITSFKLNGKAVKLGSGGTFSIPRASVVGGNTLLFEAQDKLGSKRRRVQAYLWSKVFFRPDKKKPKSGMVTPGMAFFMDKTTVDDGKHTLPPNDLATIFELYLKGMDIKKLLTAGKKDPKDPDFTFSGMPIYIDKVTYGSPKVKLVPIMGALKMTATIPNLKADLRIRRKKFLGGWSTYKGTMTATTIVINATIVPKVVGGKIKSETKNVSVVLNGFNLKVSGGVGGWIINAILGVFKNTVKNRLQAEFAKSIAGALGPAVANALNALALSFDFDLPRLDDPKKKINVSVITDMWGTDIRPDGARFDLRTGAYADKKNSISNLGVPGRVNCGSGVQKLYVPRKDKLELGLADDVLNSILYAAWLGGLLEFPVPASMSGKVDLKSYGVTDLKMKAKAYLAPTVTDCNAKKAPKAHIGDFRIDASMKLLGQPMNVVMWASFTAGVKIEVKNSAVSLSLTAIEKIDTEINVVQDKMIGSEAAIDKLISESLVKGLMGTLGGQALGSFPLPVVDLSKSMSGIPKGTGIAINPQKVLRLYGNTVIAGSLK